MQHLIEHARAFPEISVQPEELSRLASGQSPHALFITCSDSRVVPALITGARPGELFELRTAGNIVPRYDQPHPAGESATIEYAIEVLEVSDIIVCGHSHCGAVGAMARGDDLTAVPAVREWLEQATPLPAGAGTAPPDLSRPVQAHVLDQLDRLRAYPSAAARLAGGRLRLHGWFYEVHTGSVLAHRPDADAFLAL
ncbi:MULTISPECIES: carbonic anhydrase [Streptomyces]|jgi:carbonic anhydrase|uniref:carbonic anhydrase n=1 Tax=Streptomyces TaxID=1883 RepID=UPI000F74BC74|nr:carbonic anhydrase [Streptomyces sp. WAC05292]RSS92186.1 carbonic anhydrase [Streptomyces sp. WAC05292]